jgi:hypothetical protein
MANKITAKQIAEKFGVSLSAAEQQNSTQAFIVAVPYTLLFLSYTTVLAAFDGDRALWLVTDKKYSATTSKHLKAFLLQRDSYCETVTQEELEQFLKLKKVEV